MTKGIVDSSKVEAIADALREADGSVEGITLDEMPGKIRTINSSIGYEVPFVANAEGTTGSTPSGYGRVNSTVIAPACGHIREHYDFVEWNTKADGSGTSYDPGDAIPYVDGLTLYAQWTPILIRVEYLNYEQEVAAVRYTPLYGMFDDTVFIDEYYYTCGEWYSAWNARKRKPLAGKTLIEAALLVSPSWDYKSPIQVCCVKHYSYIELTLDISNVDRRATFSPSTPTLVQTIDLTDSMYYLFQYAQINIPGYRYAGITYVKDSSIVVAPYDTSYSGMKAGDFLQLAIEDEYEPEYYFNEYSQKVYKLTVYPVIQERTFTVRYHYNYDDIVVTETRTGWDGYYWHPNKVVERVGYALDNWRTSQDSSGTVFSDDMTFGNATGFYFSQADIDVDLYATWISCPNSQAYAVVTTNNMLCFFRSTSTYTNGSTGTFTDVRGVSYTGTVYNNIETIDKFKNNPWGSVKTSLTSIRAAQGQVIHVNGSMFDAFMYCSNITSANLRWLDTSQVTSMEQLFTACSKLTSVLLDSWNVTNVTTMSEMFEDCPKLTMLDLSTWHTSSLTNMMSFADGCTSLKVLRLCGNFTTANVTTGGGIIWGNGGALEYLDLSGVTYSSDNITYIQYHTDLAGLKTLVIGQNRPMKSGSYEFAVSGKHFINSSTGELIVNTEFETQDFSDGKMAGMYFVDPNQVIVHFNANGAEGTMPDQVFDYNVAETVDLCAFEKPNKKFTKWTFSGADYQTVQNVTDGQSMTFAYTSVQTNPVTEYTFNATWAADLYVRIDTSDHSMKFIDSAYQTANPKTSTQTDYSYDVDDTSNSAPYWVNNSERPNITSVSFEVDKVQPVKMVAWFVEFTSLTSLDVSKIDTSRTTDIIELFYNSTALTSLDISSWDLSNLTTLSRIFSGCTSLASVTLPSGNINPTSSWAHGFSNCSSLTELDLSMFDPNQASYWAQMYTGCSSLATIHLGSHNPFKNAAGTGTGLSLLPQSAEGFAWIRTEPDGTFVAFTSQELADASYENDAMVGTYVWDRVPSVVRFYKNDGTDEYTTMQVWGLNDYQLPNCPFTYKGHTFMGWMQVNAPQLANDQSYIHAVGTTFSGARVFYAAWRTNAHAVYDLNEETLKFYNRPWFEIDAQTQERYWGFDECTTFPTGSDWTWNAGNGSSATSIEFVDNISVKFAGLMFDGFSALVTADVRRLDVSQATDIHQMFASCSNLLELDLRNFHTSNCTDFDYMFSQCSKLRYLNIENFDTRNGTTTNIFYTTRQLKTLVLGKNFRFQSTSSNSCVPTAINSYWENTDAGLVKTSTELAEGYAENCDTWYGTWSPVLSGFGVQNGTTNELVVCRTDRYYKSNANNVSVVDIDGNTWVGRTCGPVDEMTTSSTGSTACKWYSRRSSILSIRFVKNQPKFAPKSIAYWMSLPKVENVFFPPVETHDLVSMQALFNGACSSCTGTVSFKEFTLPHKDFSKVESMKQMFQNTSLVKLDISNQPNESLTNIQAMCMSNDDLEEINATNFDVSKVTNFGQVFQGCAKLKSLDLSTWVTAAAETAEAMNFGTMFAACPELEYLDISGFDTSKAIDISSLFATTTTNIKTLVLGPNFDFSPEGESEPLVLFEPSAEAPYTGMWIRSEGTEAAPLTGQTATDGPMTGATLSSTYDGATMAGTWVWETVKYTVTFNMNEGEGLISPIEVNALSAITLPEPGNISRTGFAFAGWALNAAGTQTVLFPGHEYTPTGNTVIYAQWRQLEA